MESTILTSSNSCNLCNSDDVEIVFERGVAQEGRIVRCRNCDLMYVNPRKRVELNDYRERGEGEKAGWEVSPSGLERQRNQVRDYRHALDAAVKHAPGGAALEVGCCTGTLLNELKERGMQCLGVEPNSFAARYGREHFCLDIRVATLDEVDLEQNSFDVVLLLHVIEHLTDPIAVLRAIHRVLKPGGLLIIETPRYDTLTFRLFGRRERNVVDNWHLYFYTTETLRKSLEEAGFTVTEKCVPSRTVTPSRAIGAVGKAFRMHWLEEVGQWMAKGRVNSWCALPLNMRDILRFHAVAKK